MKFKRKGLSVLIICCLILGLFSIHIYAQGDVIDNMNFRDADVRDVLRAVAEVADVNLVTDSSVSGDITISLRKLTFSEALKMITQTQGLDYRWDGNTVVVATPERIETLYTEEVTEIIDLNVADLDNVGDIVTNIHPEINVVDNSRSGQLILNGKREDVDKALALIDNLDLEFVEEEDGEIVKTIQIRVRDIESLLASVSNVFPDILIEKSGVNDQVIFSGPEEDVEKALSLVETLEEREDVRDEDEDEERTSNIIMVNNISVSEAAEEIKALKPYLDIDTRPSTGQLIITGAENEVEDATEYIEQMDEGEAVETDILQIDYLEISDYESTLDDMFEDLNYNVNPERQSVVVHGSRQEIQMVRELTERIDVPRRQILIEVQIEEVVRSAIEEMGVDTGAFREIQFLKDDDDMVSGLSLSWPEFFNVLQDDSMAETLAHPRLMTLNGEPANLLIGDQVPVVISTDDGQEIQHVEAGVSLDFDPWITEDDTIILDVNPTVSSIGERVGGELPTINTREASTRIRLKDGESFVIGGLIRTNMDESVSGVPYLKDIPVLGKLFSQTSVSERETELLIMVKPRIVDREDRNLNEEAEKAINEFDGTAEESSTEEIDEDEIVEVEADEDELPVVEKENDEENTENKEENTEKKTVIETSKEENVEDDKAKLARTLNEVRRAPGEELPSKLNVFYYVEEGETLEEIAGNYCVSVNTIKNANNLQNGIEEGELITIPVPSSRLYRMESGDTLSSISREYDISVDELRELNNFNDVNSISSGTIIIFPEPIR